MERWVDVPIFPTSIIFPNVANDDKTLFFLYNISKMLFNKFNLIQKNVSVIFASKLMDFTDFYDKLLENLYDCNFTLNLVKKNDVP